MKCNHPPPLTADQLSDAIDGTAGAAIQEHLADCAYCAQRLTAAQLAEQKLGLKLFRWDCPPSQQLGDYEQGLLDAPEAASIAAHLLECARCTQELVVMRQFMSMPDRPLPSPPPSPVRRSPSLGELIAQLLPRSLAPALRGEVRPPLTAQAEGVTIVLDVQPGDGEQFSIQGQVAADNQDRWTGALVTLRQAGELKATAIVDDLGGFSITGLSPAPTDFRLTPQDGQPVLLRDVNLAA